MEPGWLDTVSATPLIGVRPAFAWKTGATYANNTTPFLEILHDNNISFKVGYGANWTTQIDVDGGVILKIAPDSISAECTGLQLKLTRSPENKWSATPSRNDPYSVMLEECQSQLVGLLHVLSMASPLQLNRVGVVAVCAGLSEAQVPPGVAGLVERLDGLWPQPLNSMEFAFLQSISHSNAITEQCHHRGKIDRTIPNSSLFLALDWQRQTLDASPFFGDDDFEGTIAGCVDEALAYFETVGEGGFLGTDA